MKVLIKDHRPAVVGGIETFYQMLIPFLGDKVDFVAYKCPKNKVYRAIYYLLNYFDFFLRLLFKKYDCIVVNPPLYKNTFLRDSIYCFIAKKIFHKRLYVFWHGWKDETLEYIKTKHLKLFQNCYLCADGMMVLAKHFKEGLQTLDYPYDKIYLFTTVIEDNILEIPRRYKDKSPFTVLFLSRVLKTKGIFTFLDIAKYFQNHNHNYDINFVVAGDGTALEDAKTYAEKLKLENTKFIGYVKDEAKFEALEKADIWILPTYNEGMPCALLEGMGAGLPTIITAVGGVVDFFENGRMGFMIPNVDTEKFIESIIELYEKPLLLEQMGSYNRQYAYEHFRAAFVADKMMKLFENN